MAPYFDEGIFLCNNKGDITYANPQFYSNFGYYEADVVGKMNFDDLFAEYSETAKCPEFKKHKIGKSCRIEAPIQNHNNAVLWCSITSIPEFGKDGDFVGTVNLIKDITKDHTEKIKQDRLLRLHEGFYKLNQIHTRGYNFKQISLTILQLLVATFEINVARIYKVSFKEEQFTLDLEAEKLKFKTIHKISEFLPEGIARLIPHVEPNSIYEQVIESAEPQYLKTNSKISEKFLSVQSSRTEDIYRTILEKMIIESYLLFPIVHFNETVYLIECISEHPLNDGQVDDLYALLTNVNALIDNKLSELDLQRSEKRWRELIHNSSEITSIIDLTGKIKFISQPVFRVMGYAVNEVMGKNIWDFVHPDDRSIAKSALEKRIEEGGQGDFTIYRFIAKNREYKYLRVITTVHFNNPEIDGIIINAHDVTDLIRSENEKYLVMIETQEKERQRLSRDLHDGVGQYLAAANMYIELLKPNLEKELNKENLEFFTMASQLLQKATNETRIVSHNIMPPSLKDFGFVDCLKGLIADLQHDKLTINLQILPNEEWKHYTDAINLTLFRSIQQLFNNAIEHGHATVIDLVIQSSLEATVIEVTDNGKGFDQDVLRGNEGIGLLSIQHRIQSIGGIVTIQSEKRKGTSIKITLKKN